jgi:hypothetical protein
MHYYSIKTKGKFMKSLFMGLLMTLLSVAAIADTQDTQSFNLFNGMDNYTAYLETQLTHTEYRSEEVWDTCYRTIYRRVCSNRPPRCRQVCRNGRCRRVCSGGGRYCRTIPVQRPYQCRRVIQVPYEVVDANVSTTVDFIFKNNQNNSSPVNEVFTISMDGTGETLSLKSSGNYIIELIDLNKQVNTNGSLISQTLTYTIKLNDYSAIKKVLEGGIKEVSLNNNVLSYQLGSGLNSEDYIQSLKVYRHKRIGSDIKKFDRDLKINEFSVISTTNYSSVSVDLESLGFEVPTRKRVIMETRYNTLGKNILNMNDLKLEVKSNYVFY